MITKSEYKREKKKKKKNDLRSDSRRPRVPHTKQPLTTQWTNTNKPLLRYVPFRDTDICPNRPLRPKPPVPNSDRARRREDSEPWTLLIYDARARHVRNTDHVHVAIDSTRPGAQGFPPGRMIDFGTKGRDHVGRPPGMVVGAVAGARAGNRDVGHTGGPVARTPRDPFARTVATSRTAAAAAGRVERGHGVRAAAWSSTPVAAAPCRAT